MSYIFHVRQYIIQNVQLLLSTHPIIKTHNHTYIHTHTELNDPTEQRRRMSLQQQAKNAGDEEAQIPNEDFCGMYTFCALSLSVSLVLVVLRACFLRLFEMLLVV